MAGHGGTIFVDVEDAREEKDVAGAICLTDKVDALGQHHNAIHRRSSCMIKALS